MRLPLIALMAAAMTLAAADRVLIVADEIPAMESLARQLRSKAGADSKIVTQAELPPSLADFDAVVIYVHKDLLEPTEKAVLEYVRSGHKAILIHHSISSGKRKNKEWFPAFAITLPTEKLDEGGYGYYSPASFELVNLAPGNPVTSKGVKYEKKTEFTANGAGTPRTLPSFVVPDSEIFLNHRHGGPRTKLLGIKWTDPRSGKTYQQDTGGWMMSVGQGVVFYFMAGHRVEDFSIETYAQILANALKYKKR